MPFSRPTLTQLLAQVTQDIAAELQGVDPLLRFSNLKVTGKIQANLAYLHYGYLDWISLQSVPFTATDEFLEGWAALKGVIRKAATSASGAVTFNGTPAAVIPAGSALVRGDGATFTSSADATVSGGGTAIVFATADADPSGQTGAFGNCDVGSVMTLSQAIGGVQSTGAVSTAFTGGADLESDDSLRNRMLEAFQNSPAGGASNDYVTWALEVAGVTRAWVNPNGFGAGTVVLYVMLDQAEAAHGGFPQGSNGAATGDSRYTTATGDQLEVADYILPLQPVTALVLVVAPAANPINFTIAGIASASSDTKAAIAAAIDDVFIREGSPTITELALSLVESAIAAISGTSGFVITSPTTNIANATGQIPVRGTITYTT